MFYCNQYPAYLELCQRYGFKGEFSIVDIKDVRNLDQVQVYAVLKAVKSEENSYQLNLKKINLILFPDWNQSMEVIFEQLANVCQIIIKHPKSSDIALLIDIHNIHLEDAQFLLADILMDIYFNDNKDINNCKLPEFNLLKVNLIEEYKGLMPVMDSRIILEYENLEIINQTEFKKISSFNLAELSNNPLDILILNKNKISNKENI